MKKFVIMFVFGLLILPFHNFVFADVRSYDGYPDPVQKAVYQFVKQKTGITITGSLFNIPTLETKMKMEAPNFTADMLLECSPTMSKLAKESGWSVPYISPTWRDVNPSLYDKEGYWYTTFRTVSYLVGSKDRLAKFGYSMPTSWKELIDPKWKGEILLASPLGSEMAHFLIGMFLQIYGDTKGWEFIEALNKNVAHYTKRTSATGEMVGRGEFMLGITPDTVAKHMISTGYKIETVIPKEGSPYQDYDLVILKGAKNLLECKKIIDFMGTEEFSVFMRQFGEGTTRHMSNMKVTPINFDKIRSDMKKNNEIWKQKIGL